MKNIPTFGKIFILLTTITIMAIFCFLSVAFIKAEFNPFLWEEGARGSLVFITILLSIIPIAILISEITELVSNK